MPGKVIEGLAAKGDFEALSKFTAAQARAPAPVTQHLHQQAPTNIHMTSACNALAAWSDMDRARQGVLIPCPRMLGRPQGTGRLAVIVAQP